MFFSPEYLQPQTGSPTRSTGVSTSAETLSQACLLQLFYSVSISSSCHLSDTSSQTMDFVNRGLNLSWGKLKLVFVKVSILYPSHQTSAFQSHLVKRDLNVSISVPFSAKQILPTCSHLSDICHLIITSQTLWILLSNQFSISAEANMSLSLLIWFIPLPSQYKISSSPNNQI